MIMFCLGPYIANFIVLGLDNSLLGEKKEACLSDSDQDGDYELVKLGLDTSKPASNFLDCPRSREVTQVFT